MRFCIFLVAGACWAADLTGNWVVAQPNANDGTVRNTYFDLKQEGTRITGTTSGVTRVLLLHQGE